MAPLAPAPPRYAAIASALRCGTTCIGSTAQHPATTRSSTSGGRTSTPPTRSWLRYITRWSAQGMIGHQVRRSLVGDWETKFEQDGQVITRDELVIALAPSTARPAPPRNDTTTISEWQNCWTEWLDFLVGAMSYGGFRVQ